MSGENTGEEYEGKYNSNLVLLNNLKQNNVKLIVKGYSDSNIETNDGHEKKSSDTFDDIKSRAITNNKNQPIQKAEFFRYVNSASSFWSKIFCFKTK